MESPLSLSFPFVRYPYHSPFSLPLHPLLFPFFLPLLFPTFSYPFFVSIPPPPFPYIPPYSSAFSLLPSPFSLPFLPPLSPSPFLFSKIHLFVHLKIAFELFLHLCAHIWRPCLHSMYVSCVAKRLQSVLAIFKAYTLIIQYSYICLLCGNEDAVCAVHL